MEQSERDFVTLPLLLLATFVFKFLLVRGREWILIVFFFFFVLLIRKKDVNIIKLIKNQTLYIKHTFFYD